jgi:adenylate kinase family enzyme
MGPPGSGKSTLVRQLGRRHNLPVFHLDQAFWQPGWIATAPELFRAEVERIAALPAWVIDGNYLAHAIEARLRAADTLIYLDAPTSLCMLRILRRVLLGHGRVREDMALGCPERLDLPFLHFAVTWNRIQRARHLALLGGFTGRKIVLRGRRAPRRSLE